MGSFSFLRRWMLMCVVCLPGACAFAETFLELEPLQSLSSVRQRFAPAVLIPEPASWLRPHQYYARLELDEAKGLVTLLFEHDDDVLKKKIAGLEQVFATSSDDAKIRSGKLLLQQYRERLAKPLEDRLSLVLIRWIPDKPFPVGGLREKYGRPRDTRPRDATYGPVYVWANGVTAHLSDDRKKVKMVEYWFTEDDLAVFFLRRDQKQESEARARR